MNIEQFLTDKVAAAVSTLYGNAGAMDGLIDRINEELGEECTVVATGGLAGVITPLCRHEILNEINREEVYGDILQWLSSHMKKSLP